eukprot:TRINITY_DN3420_c0_g2_i1.p1 TRINITY_DN3420_c0_g2~~TRINITY_DN3420_c0_g2_i1.p1  ORF type:complete len:1045 (-),score=206.57 TRINITY_DN3420_c0_g2_i1:35-3118(-)
MEGSSQEEDLSSSSTDIGMEMEEILHPPLAPVKQTLMKIPVLLMIFGFVMVFLVICSVVVWGISASIYGSNTSELVQQLSTDFVQEKLRQVSNNIIKDTLDLTDRVETFGVFGKYNDTTVQDYADISAMQLLLLSETVQQPQASAILYGCGNFLSAIQRVFSPNGTVMNDRLTTTFALRNGEMDNGTILWNATYEYHDRFTGALQRRFFFPNFVRVQYDPNSFANSNTSTYWSPVTFLYPTNYPLLTVIAITRNSLYPQCGVQVQLALSTSILSAWLQQNSNEHLLDISVLAVMDSRTRSLLFISDDTTPSVFIANQYNSSTGMQTVYGSYSIDNTTNRAIREASAYIVDNDAELSMEYSGFQGNTVLVTLALKQPGLSWLFIVVVPTASLVPVSTVSYVTLGVTFAIIVLAAIGSFLISRLISTPIAEMSHKMQALACADWKQQKDIRFQFIKEFAWMQAAFITMEKSLKFHTLKLDKMVKQRTKELVAALEDASRANRYKSNFLANMSHEIRTPLHGILSLITFLTESTLTSEQRAWCKDIKSSTLALTQVLNDILDLSKVEAGKMMLEAVEFDLLNLTEELVSMFYGIICETKPKTQKVELLLQYSNLLPKKMIGDPTRVRQILTNLLSNAVKFTESGHILLKISIFDQPPPLGFHLPGAQQQPNVMGVTFSVTDTGIGMTEEQRLKMFTQYTQAELSTTRKYGGTGLGLAIIKNLIRMLGGDISIESVSGEGSTFTLHFFLGVPDPEPQEAKTMKGKGLVLAPSQEMCTTVTQPLNQGIEWLWVTKAKSANRFLEKDTTVAAFLVDVSYLRKMTPDRFPVLFDKNFKARCKVVLLREARDVCSPPQFVDGVLTKPIKPSQAPTDFAKIMNITRSKPIAAQAAEDPYPVLNMNILLVEDNPINQRVASTLLKRMGCLVTIAVNGLESVEMVKKDPNAYDVILMDVMMPVMDGRTATLEIRDWELENGKRRHPIVALTAHAMVEDKNKCLEVGMDSYLSKPLEKKLLVACLKSLARAPFEQTNQE